MDYNPLFISGTSRGGTNLAIMMLSVSDSVGIAQDPFLGLYKAFNNAVLLEHGLNGNGLNNPLDEYYYYREKILEMNLLQKSDLSIPFDKSELEQLKKVIVNRMALSSPLLIPFIDNLQGKRYKDLFDSALDIVRLGRSEGKLEWLGFNDNWTSEFFGPLSKSYKKAKFISIIRDVRGAIASHVNLVNAVHTNPLYQYKKDASMLALTMSFARCWRKHVAFSYHFQQLEEMKDRLLVVRYEDLVSNPESETRIMCDFLGIGYSSDMIDTNNFISPDGGLWQPNSNQGVVPQSGIFTSSITKWKETLSQDMLDLIELITGPELTMCGYETGMMNNNENIESAYNYHKQESNNWVGGGWGWRTDNHNPELDISFELFRRNAIINKIDNEELIELLFLFPDIYQKIRNSSQ